MKSEVIQPTEDAIKDALQNDVIDRNIDLIQFLRLLNSVDGNYAIALNAKWGEGKTFFIKEAKYIIDCLTDDKDISLKDNNQELLYDLKQLSSCMTVYFDAWKYDNDDDPVLSLVWSILEEHVDIVEPKSKDLANIIVSIAEFVSGRNITEVVDSIKGEGIVEQLRATRSLEAKINDFFSLLNIEKGNKLIVFIDELDRCRPGYAVKLLERMKHYLCHDNIVVVYSLNIEQLQHVIVQAYGYGYDAISYLDRFFDIRVPLPRADISHFIKDNVLSQDINVERICKYVIEKYQLSLREILNYISQTRIVIFKLLQEADIDSTTEYVISVLLIPALVGAYMFDYSAYVKFIAGESCEDILDVLDHENIAEDIGHLLYGYDETFSEEYANPEIRLVRFKDKLRNWWENIIICSKVPNREIKFGKTHINDRTIYFIECLMAGLTDFAEYNCKTQ